MLQKDIVHLQKGKLEWKWKINTNQERPGKPIKRQHSDTHAKMQVETQAHCAIKLNSALWF